MSKSFSQADVASHNKPTDLFVTIDEDVYDLTQFQDEHPGAPQIPVLPSSPGDSEAIADNNLSPGGKKILTRVAGKDASKQFWKYHNEGILKKFKPKLQVGSLDTKKSAAPPTPPATPPPAEKKETVKAPAESVPSQTAEEAEPLEEFGDLIPFADPSWYQGVRSLFSISRLPRKHNTDVDE